MINLAVYGFPADPSIIGPFNVFDARVALSQPVLDLRALNDYRAAALNERAEARGIKSARDLVVLVAVNLYLEAVTGRQPDRRRARAAGDRARRSSSRRPT